MVRGEEKEEEEGILFDDETRGREGEREGMTDRGLKCFGTRTRHLLGGILTQAELAWLIRVGHNVQWEIVHRLVIWNFPVSHSPHLTLPDKLIHLLENSSLPVWVASQTFCHFSESIDCIGF